MVVVVNLLKMRSSSVALDISKGLHIQFSTYSLAETTDLQHNIVNDCGQDTKDGQRLGVPLKVGRLMEGSRSRSKSGFLKIMQI